MFSLVLALRSSSQFLTQSNFSLSYFAPVNFLKRQHLKCFSSWWAGPFGRFNGREMPKVDNRTFKSSFSALVKGDSVIPMGSREYSMTPGAASRTLLSSRSPEGKGGFFPHMKVGILQSNVRVSYLGQTLSCLFYKRNICKFLF